MPRQAGVPVLPQARGLRLAARHLVEASRQQNWSQRACAAEICNNACPSAVFSISVTSAFQRACSSSTARRKLMKLEALPDDVEQVKILFVRSPNLPNGPIARLAQSRLAQCEAVSQETTMRSNNVGRSR